MSKLTTTFWVASSVSKESHPEQVEILQKKIEKGVRLNKKGYEEIYSRIGRNFISVPVINDQDIADVCRANGVTDKADIKTVTADADSDLRRVKRKIWAMKKGSRRQEA